MNIDTTVRLAAEALNASAAFIVWAEAHPPLGAHYGLTDAQKQSVQAAFTSVEPPSQPLVIGDASVEYTPSWLDELSNIRFLAGTPLKANDEPPAGMLCVVDPMPRSVSDPEIDLLVQIAGLAAAPVRNDFRSAQESESVERGPARHDETERALRESEHRWRALVEKHPDPVIVSRGGKILYANPATARFFSVSSPEEARGRSIAEVIPETDHDALYERLRAIEGGTEVEPREYRVRTLDGEERVVEARGTPVYFNGERAVQTVVRDVTERKQAEQALKQSQERLELAVSGANLGLWDWYVETGEVTFNEQWAEMLGYSIDEIEPRIESWVDRVHPEDYPRVRKALQKHLEGETPFYETVYRMRAKDGSWRWRLDRGKVVERDEDGRPIRVTGLHHDITERKEAENELRSTKQFLERTLESLNEAIIVVGPDREIVACNPAVEQIFGYARDELIGQTTEVLHVDRASFERFGHISEPVLEEKGLFKGEYVMQHKDGREIITEHTITPLDEADWSRGVVSVVRDITERKETEWELRESEARNRAMLQAIPDLIFRFSEEGVYLDVRAEQEEQLAQPADRLIGKSVDAVLPPDLAERWKGAIREAIETRAVQQIEYPLVTKDGKERIFEARIAPLGEDEAEAIVRDITERKRQQEELVAAKERAEEMNRLKSAFLANMSHELRTPLTSILGFAEILAEEVSDQNREFAQLIAQSGRRLMGTLNSVLDLARLESKTVDLEAERINLIDRVQEAISVFEIRAQDQGLELRADLPGGPVPVWADQNAIDRILNNLISNALKFTPEGAITLRLRERDEQVCLHVIDTGVGIDADFLPQIFKEFRQESTGATREYEGVGLGLTITHRLVDLMDGTIDVESTKGEGTTFTVQLPKAGQHESRADTGG